MVAGSVGRTQPGVAHLRRAPLDGLRALAVTAVVVYHFGGGNGSILGGGFLGVDLFFVLSGYLITGLLVQEYRRNGSIDLLAFWARRLRRLLPALVLMLLGVCAATWWFARPETWAALRSDVFWTLAYLANWHFVAVGEDYFAGYVGASPLRHTWSLAIEEQFYAGWPLVVAGVLTLGARRRGGRHLMGLTVVLVLLSAAAMAWQYDSGSLSRAYFGTDGRVQQLLVGAILAMILVFRTPRLRATAGATAMVLLLAAFVLLADDSAAYYRGGALLFAIAAAAVIADVELNPLSRLARWLSWAPAVSLGRISYAVYLWHWPVLVFVPAQGGSGDAQWWWVQGLRVLITLALSVLSLVLVERPVLTGRVPWLGQSPSRTAMAAVTAAAVVVAVAVASTHLPGRLQQQLADRADTPCPGEALDRLVDCVQQQGSASRPVLLLLGDSTARALVPGLRQAALLNDTTLTQAAWQRCTSTGLLVVPNGMRTPDDAALACAAQTRTTIRRALRDYRPDTVVVSEFWAHHQPILLGDRMLQPGSTAHSAALESAYVALVDDAAGSGGRVVFIELAPPGLSIGPFVAAGRPAGRARQPFTSRYVTGFNTVLHEVARRRPGLATTVSITDLLCPRGSCAALQDGRVVRPDGVHVSAEYSKQLAPVLLARLDSALADLPPPASPGVRR